jgi:hypothetical protein
MHWSLVAALPPSQYQNPYKTTFDPWDEIAQCRDEIAAAMVQVET